MTLDRPCSVGSSLVSVYLIPSVPLAHKFTCRPADIWVVGEAGNPSLLPGLRGWRNLDPFPSLRKLRFPSEPFPCSSTLSSQGVKLLKTKPKREVFCRQLLLSAFHKPPLMKLSAGGQGRRKYEGKYYISITKLTLWSGTVRKNKWETWNMWTQMRMQNGHHTICKTYSPFCARYRFLKFW